MIRIDSPFFSSQLFTTEMYIVLYHSEHDTFEIHLIFFPKPCLYLLDVRKMRRGREKFNRGTILVRLNVTAARTRYRRDIQGGEERNRAKQGGVAREGRGRVDQRGGVPRFPQRLSRKVSRSLVRPFIGDVTRLKVSRRFEAASPRFVPPPLASPRKERQPKEDRKAGPGLFTFFLFFFFLFSRLILRVSLSPRVSPRFVRSLDTLRLRAIGLFSLPPSLSFSLVTSSHPRR